VLWTLKHKGTSLRTCASRALNDRSKHSMSCTQAEERCAVLAKLFNPKVGLWFQPGSNMGWATKGQDE
jgi:hypothetical protein